MWLIGYIKTKRMKRRITFEDITNEWLEIKRKEVKESTLCNYAFQAKKHLMPELQYVTLNILEKYDYSEFVEEMCQDLGTKTVRDILSIFKSVLFYAEEQYECHFNVKKIKVPKLSQEPVMALHKKEKEKLEKYCLNENNLMSIGIVICMHTGLRLGEICSLKWENVNLEKREIYVRSTVQRVYDVNKKKSRMIITEPKTKNSIRNIPISDKLYQILKGLSKKYEPSDFLLSRKFRKLRDTSKISKIF